MNAPENPPAFPGSPDAHHRLQEGMTLRDWFAGQALAGLCANHTWLENVHKARRVVTDTAAGSAYEYADAMLCERAKGGDA